MHQPMRPQEDSALILIVEDDLIRQQAIRRILETAGYQVAAAAGGAAGLELARQMHPALILLDEMLPDIRGLEVCRQVKASPELAGILVMMLSGLRISSDEQAAGLEVGADAYVAWPVSHRELVARVEALLRLKRAEEAVRQQRDFADSMVETAPLIVLVLDMQGHIIRFNPHMEQVSGYQLAEVQGKDWFSTFLPAAGIEAVRRQFQQAMAAVRTASYANFILTRDGSQRLIEWYDTPLRSSSGQITGLLAFGQDITERRQMEEKLLQSRKMETVAQLAAGVAHDFNNLLTGIIGFAELLQMEMPPGTSQRDMLDRIVNSGSRAARLVNHLLAFARKQMIQPLRLDLNDAIARLRTRWQMECTSEINIDTHAAIGLWPLWMDSQQVEQILLNLVEHLCQNLPAGGHISITTRNYLLDAFMKPPTPEMEPGDYVWLAISDSGAGLDAETRDRIFEPFFFTTTEVASDVGLRLAAVHGIVAQNHGHIWVDSRPDEGTTFHIYLPRSTAASP